MPAARTDSRADTITPLLWSKLQKLEGVEERSDTHLLLMRKGSTCLTKL